VKGEAQGKRLTVFVGEYDRYQHRPLGDAILDRAREAGLAGGTLIRGIEGFGRSRRLKTARLLSSSDDLPVLVEIVDRADRIEAFLPTIAEMAREALITIEDVLIRSHGET
jgi:PII-like signaling protein